MYVETRGPTLEELAKVIDGDRVAFLAEIENLTGKVTFVIAGYDKQMEAFFAHNPGIPGRIPIEMEFKVGETLQDEKRPRFT